MAQRLESRCRPRTQFDHAPHPPIRSKPCSPELFSPAPRSRPADFAGVGVLLSRDGERHACLEREKGADSNSSHCRGPPPSFHPSQRLSGIFIHHLGVPGSGSCPESCRTTRAWCSRPTWQACHWRMERHTETVPIQSYPKRFMYGIYAYTGSM